MLIEAFPKADEGELSRRLAELVRAEACADVAEAMDLGPYHPPRRRAKRVRAARKKSAILRTSAKR